MKALLTAGAVLLTGIGTQPEHLRHYEAFTEALDAGDRDAAVRHGEAAWRAAEGRLGTHETTALLAQNYLDTVLWDDPSAAAEAAARALALAEAGYGTSNMPMSELRIAKAYTEAAERPRRGRLDALTEAIAADRATGRPLNTFLSRAYMQASLLALEAGDEWTTYELATSFSEELAALDSAPRQLVAAANIQRVAAMLSTRKWRNGGQTVGTRLSRVEPRFEARLKDSHVLIDGTIAMFAPQEGIDAFDPVLGMTLAWQGVVRSLEASFETDPDEDWEFEGRGLDGDPTPLIERPAGHPSAEDCVLDWEERPMRYPPSEVRRGYNGGVAIGYHLTPEGRVTGARILGEVPRERFGPQVLEDVGRWKAETEGVDPRCLRDKIAQISFAMNP